MFKDLISKAVKNAAGFEGVELEIPENENFGDYSTNIALVKAKEEDKNSREYAEEIITKLSKDSQLNKFVEKIEVAGAGFINFWLRNEVLIKELENIAREKEKYGSSKIGQGKTVVLDYSSPNIAKRFGIGHLRSTIIGQSLYNLYQTLGYKVIGDNHLGDWGTQFGTLLYQITSQNLNPKDLNIDKLEELYVDFHKKAEKDEKLMEQARLWFKKLEEGDSRAREIWQALIDTSLAEFERIYSLLGIKIDYAYGESFYEDKMPAVIAEIRQKRISQKSQGAEIIEFAASSKETLPPAMPVKSNGTSTYFTRDLATIKSRLENWQPDIFIYEVGADQTLHFRQLFEVAKLLGWTKNKEFVHIGHGLIRWEHGKMSTRRGDTVKLEDVLDMAIEKSRSIIKESDTSRGLNESEIQEVSHKVGIGAVKYFDLMHQPTSDIIFNWEKIFVLEGNSGPYLQYTVARINSVLAKSKKVKELKSVSVDNEELSILRTLCRFGEIIAMSAKNYSPNLLCNYLFDLAQKYNGFYNKDKIIGGENEDFRLALTFATGQVLKNGLAILGIQTPERM